VVLPDKALSRSFLFEDTLQADCDKSNASSVDSEEILRLFLKRNKLHLMWQNLEVPQIKGEDGCWQPSIRGFPNEMSLQRHANVRRKTPQTSFRLQKGRKNGAVGSLNSVALIAIPN
jgi:hypothetical protein